MAQPALRPGAWNRRLPSCIYIGALGAIKLGLTSGDAQVRAAAVEAAGEAYLCLGRGGIAPVLLGAGRDGVGEAMKRVLEGYFDDLDHES